MNKLSVTTSLLLICITLSACDSKTNKPTSESATSPLISPSQTTKNQQSSLSIFLDTAATAALRLDKASIALQQAVEAFTQTPSPDKLLKAQQELQTTHHHYLLMQVFQNIDILNPEFDLFQTQPSVIHPLNIRLDQHPMISGYLDAVPDFPASGLIFNEHALTPEYLNNEHQFSDKAYVAIGFHALEFMLKGGLNQKLEERSLDFKALSMTTTKLTPPLRRSQYAQILSSLIRDDIKKLTAAWSTRESFYPQALSKLLPVERNRLIQQAYELESHTLSQATGDVNEDHLIATKARNAQIARFLETKADK